MKIRSFSPQCFASFAALILGIFPGAAAPQDGETRADLDTLRDRVEELSNLAVRTQSHIMMDVEYHFANLWFAAHNEQWELASFYLRETDSHLRWTVRVRPMRTIRGGGSVDLPPFQESIEQSGFAAIESAIERKDASGFEAAYRQTLAQCHACHQAAGLGYLEPRVPETPPSALMLHPE